MQILLRWAVNAVALYLTVLIAQHLHIGLWLAKGTEGVQAVVIAVVLMAIANAVIRPVVGLLTLPLTCLTLGLFTFVVNAFMFWLVGQFVPGFHVRGILAPLFGSIVMAVISGALSMLLISDKEKTR